MFISLEKYKTTPECRQLDIILNKKKIENYNGKNENDKMNIWDNYTAFHKKCYLFVYVE